MTSTSTQRRCIGLILLLLQLQQFVWMVPATLYHHPHDTTLSNTKNNNHHHHHDSHFHRHTYDRYCNYRQVVPSQPRPRPLSHHHHQPRILRFLPRFHQQQQQHYHQQIGMIRGGGAYSSDPNQNNNNNNNNEYSTDQYGHGSSNEHSSSNHEYKPNHQYPTTGMGNGDDDYVVAPTEIVDGETSTTTFNPFFPNDESVSVQERLDAWKQQQQQLQQQQPSSSSSSYVDAKGQTKLLVSIGQTSRAVIFFIYMWRIWHLYESVVAASSAGSSTSAVSGVITTLLSFRPVTLLTIPLALLFVGNLLATLTLVVSTTTNHTTKKRCKAILNGNKFVEVINMAYTLMRLVVAPSPDVTKEIYMGRILHSMLFLIQGQAYTRFSWDSEAIAPSYGAPTLSSHRAAATTTDANFDPYDRPSPPPPEQVPQQQHDELHHRLPYPPPPQQRYE